MEITDISTYINTLGQYARDASTVISSASTAEKNEALNAIARSLIEQKGHILTENAKDMEAGRENQLTSALLDRLELN